MISPPSIVVKILGDQIVLISWVISDVLLFFGGGGKLFLLLTIWIIPLKLMPKAILVNQEVHFSLTKFSAIYSLFGAIKWECRERVGRKAHFIQYQFSPLLMSQFKGYALDFQKREVLTCFIGNWMPLKATLKFQRW